MTDERIGGTVVFQRRLVGLLKLRNDLLRQNFAEFHAPLIEGVDLPDGPLREDAVFV